MESVASRNEVAADLVPPTVLAVPDAWGVGRDIQDLHVRCLIDEMGARLVAGVHQVTGHFGLTVDRHVFARHQGGKVDPVACPGKRQFDTVVYQTRRLQAPRDAGLLQQPDRALLQHARTDPSQHVLPAARLQEQRIHPGEAQQPRQQLPGGTPTYDHHLRSHGFPF